MIFYFMLGFVLGALFVLILFTLWYDDQQELERMEEAVRQAEGWGDK